MRPPRLPARALAALAFALHAAPALAQDAPSPEEAARLEREAEAARAEAERLQNEADAQAAEIERLQRALVDAARDQSDREREALATEARLAALSRDEARLAEQAADDRETLRDVFAALARLQRARPPAVLAAHGDALSAARAASLLADVAPALESRADEALARLDMLAALRAEMDEERTMLAQSEAELSSARVEIVAMIDARTAEVARLRADSTAEAQAAADLAARVATLRELIAALEERTGPYAPPPQDEPVARPPLPRLKPDREDVGAVPPPFVPATGRFADARGALPLPVAGELVSRFGDPAAGVQSEGMVLRTRPGALVTAPFDARIEYAGAYGSYGRLVILSMGENYHIVLAGLGRLDGVGGQTVLAGEPIGQMADLPRSSPRLYLEIRKDGQTIDPGPWWRNGG
jgi:septal ring factor EnvC (AmiA/AmiB activator)